MIYQIDPKTDEIIGKFESVSHASEETEIVLTNIAACVRGVRKTAGGFRWEFREEEEETESFEKRTHTFEHEYTNDSVRFTGVLKDVDIKTLDDLLKYTDVDLSVWEVKNWTTKAWYTAMKAKKTFDTATAAPPIPGQGFVGKPYQEHTPIQVLNLGFTVNFVPRIDYKEKLKALLKEGIPKVTPVYPVSRSEPTQVVEFMITDHHLGKAGFDSKTMTFNWDIPTAVAEYHRVIEYGLSQLNPLLIKEILLIAGNDYLHIDGNLGQTTSGTKVGDSQFYLNLFRYGKTTLATAINKLVAVAPVRVIFIPGNHDETGTLTLSEVITEMFADNPYVKVQSGGNGREYYNFGVNFLAWHHGKGNSPEKAARMMIADRPEYFAKSKYRACHVGHTHKTKRVEQYSLVSVDEDHGIIYEVCPSVTPTDFWHDQNLFIGSMRRSKIFVYDEDKGLIAEHIYTV